MTFAGRQPWGITWWIEGRLIPVLILNRGQTYTFVVEGGNDATVEARYHPLYITDDADGGRAQRSGAARARETVYAGELNGQPTAGEEGTESWRSFGVVNSLT